MKAHKSVNGFNCIPDEFRTGTHGLIDEDECKSPEYRQGTFIEITENIHNLAKEVQGGSDDDPFRKLAKSTERLIRLLNEIRMEGER